MSVERVSSHFDDDVVEQDTRHLCLAFSAPALKGVRPGGAGARAVAMKKVLRFAEE